MDVFIVFLKVVILMVIISLIIYIKSIIVIKRQAKLYFAVIEAMKEESFWEKWKGEMTSEDIHKEILSIAGNELFVFNLKERIEKSRIPFIYDYYINNQKLKAFEKKINEIRSKNEQ